MSTKISLDGAFYPKYRELNAQIPSETFQCAEEVVGALLATATTSDRPAMLLGKVQSGKTRTFISAMALAFDNGYDIAIVLSKNSKALIEQTKKRLEGEFASFLQEEEMEIYDIMSAPTTFGDWELQSKLILLAKKQDDNLARLIALFRDSPAMAGKRILIIDDEADSASIGYFKKEGLIEARKIAKQVSHLRLVIADSSFLQVTATPYSLYLQPQDVEVANVAVFKPTRPAFTKLVPIPDGYVGGETYFGEASRSEGDTLESLIHHPVDHREFDRLKKPDGRSLKLETVLTAPAIEGYRTAFVTFLVGGAIQRINGQKDGDSLKKLRYSFLVHSEAGKQAHLWQEKLTKALVAKLGEAAQSEQALFSDLITKAHADLSNSLALDAQPIPTLEEVQVAVKEALNQGQITISKVNSDEDVAALLDSTGQLRLRTPYNIFLGGQVLDRGVTLANLIAFYYGRRPNKFQQDTVLQHSRMYGFRRQDLAVTRFYTSRAIRHVMAQMEDFDSSLRDVIAAGGDGAVQFIRKANDGSIVPCSPNKILVASTQTLRPHKRILPVGFQTGYATGAHGIQKAIERIDRRVAEVCGFGAARPELVPLATAIELLDAIAPTLVFDEDEALHFDWDAAKAALTHLSYQHADTGQKGRVLLWAARDRNIGRLAGASSHATFIETPDSEKTEGRMASTYAIEHPILFLLRQDGSKEKGWQGTPFYWPVVRAQERTPTAVYTTETID